MEIAFGVMDVARQTAEPAPTQARPQQRANQGNYQTGEYQKFSCFVHSPPKIIPQSKAGNARFILKNKCVAFKIKTATVTAKRNQKNLAVRES
jgi:hypothetical protein